jgi:hypothetical protein
MESKVKFSMVKGDPNTVKEQYQQKYNSIRHDVLEPCIAPPNDADDIIKHGADAKNNATRTVYFQMDEDKGSINTAMSTCKQELHSPLTSER